MDRWQALSELAQSLAHGLRLDTSALGSYALLGRANELVHMQERQVVTGTAPPAAARALKALAQTIGDFPALLQQLLQQQQGLRPDVARLHAVMLSSAACCSIIALLAALHGRQMSLPEAELRHMLTGAAGVVLDGVPPQLDALAAAAATGDGGAPSGEACDSLSVLLGVQAQAMHRLMCLVMEPGSGAPAGAAAGGATVPRRVAAAVRASRLTPERLLSWAAATARALPVSMRAAGTYKVGTHAAMTLRQLFATDEVPGLPSAVERQPEVQRQLVAAAAYALSLPEAERKAVAQDQSRCYELQELAQMAAADCLAEGRRRHQAAASDAGRGSSGGGGGEGSRDGAPPAGCLLVAAVSLAISLRRQRSASHAASLIMACLELQAALAKDSLSSGGSTARRQHRPCFTAAQLAAMGSSGGLPLLCQLATDVAAAAPGAPPALAASVAQRGAPGGEDNEDGEDGNLSFGQLCWQDKGREWDVVLSRWCIFLGSVIVLEVEHQPQPRGQLDSCAAAWRTAEALLRLQALLPWQPTAMPDGAAGRWYPAGRVVAAAGGMDRAMARMPQVRPAEALLIAQAAPFVAERLLVVPPTVPGTSAAAAAAFSALSAACRTAHAAYTVLKPGGGSSGSGSGQHGIFITAAGVPLLHRLLDQGMELALQSTRGLAASLSGEERTAANRRLECCLLLYLQAMHTLTAGLELPLRDEEGFERRFRLLRRLLAELALEPLWRQLLGSGGSAAAGFEAAWVLGDATAMVINDVRSQAAATRGRRLAEADFEPCRAPFAVLEAALELEPTAAAALARRAPLLRMLWVAAFGINSTPMARPPGGVLGGGLGGGLMGSGWPRAQVPQDSPRAAVWRLIKRVAPHLPIDPATRSALEQQLATLPTLVPQLDAVGLQAFNSAINGVPDVEYGSTEGSRQAGPGQEGEARALALRRAHALGARQCGNPCCASLAGASEVQRKGRRCSVCLTVRFCSQECQRAEWPRHKLACKALRREREREEAGGPAAG